MDLNVLGDRIKKPVSGSKRFATLDFARGLAIFLMIGLHTLILVLNIDVLLADLDNLPLVNLIALAIIPFYGGLAGFFLIVSASSNMVSMYRELERGESVKGLVIKQVVGGFLLLIFAMLCEALIGYNGALGNFFKFLNNPADYFQYNPLSNYEHFGEVVNYNWQVLLWRSNHFETIHTIAWCIILNGCIQGLLSLKKNWQNRKRLIISYAILAVVVVALTLPVWELVKVILPGYPFGLIPETGNMSFVPVIGQDSWWRIVTAPFFSALAAPMEPLFPYLAISFIGSIIGIVISKPREEINKKFPRNMFLIGTGMFLLGIVGVIIIIINFMNAYGFEAAAELYQYIPYHRHWSPDFDPRIPLFAWLAQFLVVNGYSIMLIMFFFRLIEFRGKSKLFSDKTKFVRRFGTVALSNYNNQFLFYYVFFFTSSILTFVAYQKLFWGGLFFTIFLAYALYYFILKGWEKIRYVGSLEWLIRTIGNNIVPARKLRFDSSVKWWQKGQINVEKTFYNPTWIDLSDPIQEKEKNEEQFCKEQRDSKLALILSIVGLVTILFNIVSIIGLFVSLNARKTEGKNKRNKAAFIMSIIGTILFIAFYVACFSIKIGTLGLF
ncbi:MAG TPA: heparan-alpha-glucosaminide N-acetyltransferase domain-containing protein [Candidatus Bathyarchaeia archaeon]|nr:heparan-alpha-glucosaminide N-acetyltransferase domain-containing protein [Candidatus Bathyarchaeia archaeon]